jgi:hypothetical protein
VKFALRKLRIISEAIQLNYISEVVVVAKFRLRSI